MSRLAPFLPCAVQPCDGYILRAPGRLTGLDLLAHQFDIGRLVLGMPQAMLALWPRSGC